MQNARDTFYYDVSRDRLGWCCNLARTMVLRGATLPGACAEENELVSRY